MCKDFNKQRLAIPIFPIYNRKKKEGRILMDTLKLPIGIENFEEIRTEGFYYVDKTGMISDLLRNWGKANLFTRPRRFGKSLNMDMLRYFFSYGCNARLFDGLAIAGEKELCEKYMGKFPVISITFKNAESMHFSGAQAALCRIFSNEAQRFSFLSESPRLTEDEKETYRRLSRLNPDKLQESPAENELLRGSLQILSCLLHKHYNQKVILIIDEYDVPLDKAQQYGYYDEMLDLIRAVFGQSLKTNSSLQFAVLTGCLRIARESIFTGLNNFKVRSITDNQFHEYFGFTDNEVKAMLKYYGLTDNYTSIKEWYDGYHFGESDLYCPWDVLNYVDLLRADPGALPRTYWINTSGNAILRTFIRKATPRTRRELEQLINGECITKKINQELTYRELYGSIDNLWSILFTTGYLTFRAEAGRNLYKLSIPNQEIRVIFAEQILAWFQEEAEKDAPTLDAFCEAFRKGDAAAIERQFNIYLKKTISIRDTVVRKVMKENFYHGILLGLLSHREDWDVCSNAESGEGYSDIQVEIPDDGIGIVIEMKYPDNGNLENGCLEALSQIEKNNYANRLVQDGMTTVFKYGIACYKKTCRVQIAPG